MNAAVNEKLFPLRNSTSASQFTESKATLIPTRQISNSPRQEGIVNLNKEFSFIYQKKRPRQATPRRQFHYSSNVPLKPLSVQPGQSENEMKHEQNDFIIEGRKSPMQRETETPRKATRNLTHNYKVSKKSRENSRKTLVVSMEKLSSG